MPILVDKNFADLLKKYAESIAKAVLGKRFAGLSLSDDIKRALRENILKLREAIARGEISRDVLDEYKKIFKQVLAKICIIMLFIRVNVLIC